MARFTTSLTVTTPKETASSQLSGDYTEVFSYNQILDNGDTASIILSNSTDIGTLSLSDCKTLLIKNSGSVGAELLVHLNGWTHGSPDDDTSAQYISILLASGEFIMLPNLRILGFSAIASAARGFTLDNQVPDSNMYTDSGADTTEGFADDNDTTITFDDGSGSSAGNMFKAGDLIRLDNEVCRVISHDDSVFTVERAVHGTAKADHTNNTNIMFPFFNAYADFDKYTTVQTDASGRFKCFNLMGFGRYTTAEAGGIVPGSVSGKFYTAGYQELGMSGITSSTESGLVASTAYAFDIAVDGGSDHTLAFTTSSNTKFGGSDGIIRKIQDALDTAYYAPNTGAVQLFEKRITCAITNGDIRFTSGQRLSTSAISITAPASGTTPFGVGRFQMAVGDIEAAVAAKLPDDVIYDKKTNISRPNVGVMFYDDGKGNISGSCNGTINYETGAIDISGCPPNANFVVSANYGSAHSGGNKFGASDANAILQIKARSTNPKIHTTIELMALK